MGTRCITVVKEHDGKDIIVLYRQFDGYPDGHGAELKERFQGFAIGNGRTGKPHYANGVGCLAAQVVAAFKTEDGGFYLYPSGTRECGEEYIYELDDRAGKIGLKLYDGPMTMFGMGGEDCTKLIYDGLLDDFDPNLEQEAA